eukprot:scaffold417_cov388-Prasinococcus_capsulatus_cf.AAC.1
MPKQKRGLKSSADEKGRSNKQDKMGNQRTAATVRRLNMYKRRPIRDKHGKVTKQEYQSKELPNTRIVPDRRWFGNTRYGAVSSALSDVLLCSVRSVGSGWSSPHVARFLWTFPGLSGKSS